MNSNRYRAVTPVQIENRTWPDKRITEHPTWCSVDLRDGNQALDVPMTVKQKLAYFELLTSIGFKQIEVGFPAASGIEYDFVRELSEKALIPDDVWVQVLSQCRPHLIERTIQAVSGIRKVLFHIYNNTSPLQRSTVYKMSRGEILKQAVDSALMVKRFAESFEGEVMLEYSPESFNETEPEFVLSVCNAVIEAWKPSKEHPMIINLPTTVENTSPNMFADRIEWLSGRLVMRDCIILSVHPHNDRGTGVAAAELAMLAGATRIEGTLFGNGERAGNVDIINIACNLLSEGIEPGLELTDIPKIRQKYEMLSGIPVHERHPYAGDLVFTAFSGGHQDAINKGLKAMEDRGDGIWDIPYLPIDPADIGRKYEPFVRINSQSGKGGVAFIMETYHGFRLPKHMHREFTDTIQRISEAEGEVDPDRIMAEFKRHYIDMKAPYHFLKIKTEDVQAATVDNFHTIAEVTYEDHGVTKTFTGKGNGPIDAVKIGLAHELNRTLRVLDYSEHALNEGSNAQAAAYICLMDAETGRSTYGVGVSQSTMRASVRAIFSALNRLETGVV